MGVETPHECALLALRAEVRVDLPQRRLDLHARNAAHRLDRQARRDVDHPALPDLVEERIGATADEDDVDVADVVQLARPGLAHADDGEPRRLDLLPRKQTRAGGTRDTRAGDAEGCLERRPRRIRECRRDCRQHRDGVVGGQVERRDPGEQTAIAHA